MHQCLTINSVSNKSHGLGYTPEMIKKAYNLGNIGDGNGVTCAIIDFIGNPYVNRNLKVFSDTFDLPFAYISELGRTMNQSFDFSAYIEPCVDSQWLHAIAPLASIVVVRAPQYSSEGAVSAIEIALETRADIILLTFQSMNSEVFLESLDLFSKDAVFIASAGDYGAQANFPSCIPECISVGGTVLDISESGQRLSEETAWEGSGGGICEYFEIPDFQKSMLGISEQTDGKRGVPDVSFLAAPSPGFAVYHSSAQGKFGWYNVGGTSVSASVVAGIIANMLSSDRFSNLKKSDVLPEFYRLAGDTSYNNKLGYFVDIIDGNNGKFYARKGFDLCTGLGSLINF